MAWSGSNCRNYRPQLLYPPFEYPAIPATRKLAARYTELLALLHFFRPTATEFRFQLHCVIVLTMEHRRAVIFCAEMKR